MHADWMSSHSYASGSSAAFLDADLGAASSMTQVCLILQLTLWITMPYAGSLDTCICACGCCQSCPCGRIVTSAGRLSQRLCLRSSSFRTRVYIETLHSALSLLWQHWELHPESSAPLAGHGSVRAAAWPAVCQCALGAVHVVATFSLI